MKKQDARSFSTETQEVIRRRTVRAVRDGMQQTAAARHFGVARGTVARWMKMVRTKGIRSLAGHKKGRPRGASRLTGWQVALVVRAIKNRTPDQLKLPFALWTREAVQAFIARKFNVRVSLVTMGRWLKRWGFTPQKPVRRAWEQDPQAVEQWLQVEYPRIRQQAKEEGAEIHWGDEMGVRSDHQTGASYGVKGHTPVIPGTGQRYSCHMISTVTNRGTLRFMVFHKKFTTQVLITFLDRLLKNAKRKLYLIVDRHPVHKAQKVKRWFDNHCEQIQLFFLPAYSPELNPDEMLNNDVKSNAVGRRRPTNRYELLANVRGYLRSTQKQPTIVKNYFHSRSVQYAADQI